MHKVLPKLTKRKQYQLFTAQSLKNHIIAKMCCRALLLVIFLMSFSKVKLEDCGIIEQEEIDLNEVADWANNLPALKKQDEQKWNLLQNSLQGRGVNNKYVLSYRIYQKNFGVHISRETDGCIVF